MHTLTAFRSSRRRMAALVATLLLAATFLSSGILSALAADPAPRVAFLARSDNPVDALAASAVAAQAGGVVLLTRSDRLEQAAADGLAGYKPDLVILAGGASALSPQVEQDVSALGFPWERISGASRTETARKLADRLQTLDRAYLGVDGTATNSERLQGRNADGLTRAASFESSDVVSQGPGLAIFTNLGDVDITTPGPGWLVITGGVHWNRQEAGQHVVHCMLRVDGEAVEGSVRGTRSDQLGQCSTQARVEVGTGDHTIRFLGQAAPYAANQPAKRVDYSHRSVVVQFVPFDGQGAALPSDVIAP